MKPKIFILLLFLLYSFSLLAQDSLKKTNPIVYGEAGVGVPIAGVSGIQFNFSLNYQLKKSLLTFRYTTVNNYSTKTIALSPVTIFPSIQANGNLNEYAFLYGRRFINQGFSFSFSGGFSINDSVSPRDQQSLQVEDHYLGFPFEVNVLWFKSKKKRYRIYGMIPVGKPTGFGGSFGFKLSGNVSQHSYASLGIVLGQGYSRSY